MNPSAKNPAASTLARRFLLTALITVCPAVAQAAEAGFPAPNWSTTAAQEASAEADVTAILAPLFERARLGEDSVLVEELERLAADEGLPLPARERVLFEFAVGLSDLAPGAVGPGVTDYLLAYTARTLIPHPDHARVGAPLFNVRAAAAGTLNAWQRQAGYDAASGLFSGGNRAAAATYLESLHSASAPRSQGLLEALSAASDDQLAEIADQALAEGPSNGGDLFVAGARSALLLGDAATLRNLLAEGRGPELSGLLAEAAEHLDEPARFDLLNGLLAAAPANAALAIATLAPGLLNRPEIADRLFGLLGDPELGAAAALALSTSGPPMVQERLRELAAGEGLSSRRAAIALDAAASRRRGGGR